MNPELFESHLLSMLLRAAVLAAIALGVGILLHRRCSAHSMAQFWRGSLLAICVLVPVLFAFSPPIPILPAKAEVSETGLGAVQPESTEASSAELVTTPATSPAAEAAAKSPLGAKSARQGSTHIPWLAIVWLAGVAIVLSRWLVAVIRVRIWWRAARAVDLAGWDP